MRSRFGIDIQRHQMLNLIGLILLAKWIGLFYLSWMNLVVIVIAAICVEQCALYIKHHQSYFSVSAVITAMGVALMMASSHLWIYVFVISLGLLQKHLLRVDGRHFFNPSNFALLMALLFFYEEAHIVLGQLGGDSRIMGGVALLALLILWRVDRWLIPLVFMVSYALLEYYFIIRPDPVMTLEMMRYRFTSVSFVVFMVFMLTDPRTTPHRYIYQGVFAICVALGAVILDGLQGFRVQHLFLALAFCSPWAVLAALWQSDYQRGVLFSMALVLIVFIIGAVFVIEMKPPYYFSMDG